MIKVNDINIYYEIHGEGEPLVFIVGLGADVSEYANDIHSLAKKYKVIAFDNRGAGRTEKPDSPYSIEIMAEDTFGLMQALGIKCANIVGQSMGGRIALVLALMHPERIKKLVLVSTSARSVKNWRISVFGWARVLPILSSKHSQPRFAFVRQYKALATGNYSDRLHELKIPTAIMHGRKDRIIAFKFGEELHEGIHNSIFLAFNGGHLFLFGKELLAFSSAVNKFIG